MRRDALKNIIVGGYTFVNYTYFLFELSYIILMTTSFLNVFLLNYFAQKPIQGHQDKGRRAGWSLALLNTYQFEIINCSTV